MYNIDDGSVGESISKEFSIQWLRVQINFFLKASSKNLFECKYTHDLSAILNKFATLARPNKVLKFSSKFKWKFFVLI